LVLAALTANRVILLSRWNEEVVLFEREREREREVERERSFIDNQEVTEGR
jgi:hypothetical protein